MLDTVLSASDRRRGELVIPQRDVLSSRTGRVYVVSQVDHYRASDVVSFNYHHFFDKISACSCYFFRMLLLSGIVVAFFNNIYFFWFSLTFLVFKCRRVCALAAIDVLRPVVCAPSSLPTFTPVAVFIYFGTNAV